MAASAMVGQQMEMMGSRVKAQSRAESLTARNRELYETQRRARRGPTPEVFFTKHIDNSRIVKADDPERRLAVKKLRSDPLMQAALEGKMPRRGALKKA